MLREEDFPGLKIEHRDDGVALVTLNRPERLNAVNGPMHNALSRLPLAVDTDPDIRVLVITGAGRAFCSGGDFGGGDDSLASQEERPRRQPTNQMHEPRLLLDNFIDLEKPVIMAVNGYAMGLGATLALVGDVVVAGKSSVFADTHVKMGLGAGDGGAVLWPLLIGPARAKYYLMTGDRVSGEEAERMGLVNFLVEDDEVLPRAMEIAERLANGPLAAISASKVPTNKLMKFVSNLVFPLSLALESQNVTSAEHKEAVRAFQEKREPDFRNAKL